MLPLNKWVDAVTPLNTVSDHQKTTLSGLRPSRPFDDFGGASNQIVDDATSRGSRSTGCPAQNFLISATHTHSSNTGGLGGRGAPTAKTVADAIVEAANAAKSKLAPARVGYGTTKVDLNVNRDLFNRKLEWRQEPNPEGPSDKTLAVVEFVGSDNIPIGVYMNYAMHPSIST
jgi:hypothetical protein